MHCASHLFGIYIWSGPPKRAFSVVPQKSEIWPYLRRLVFIILVCRTVSQIAQTGFGIFVHHFCPSQGRQMWVYDGCYKQDVNCSKAAFSYYSIYLPLILHFKATLSSLESNQTKLKKKNPTPHSSYSWMVISSYRYYQASRTPAGNSG